MEKVIHSGNPKLKRFVNIVKAFILFFQAMLIDPNIAQKNVQEKEVEADRDVLLAEREQSQVGCIALKNAGGSRIEKNIQQRLRERVKYAEKNLQHGRGKLTRGVDWFALSHVGEAL